MSDIILPSLSQLLVQSPVLLVYLLGMILAFVFWHRSPSTGTLVLLGTGLLLFSSIVWPFVFQYVIRMRAEWGWEHERLGAVLSGIGLVASFIHAVGLALLLVGAFVGRRGQADDLAKSKAPRL